MTEIDAIISVSLIRRLQVKCCRILLDLLNCFKYCEAERCVASDLDLLLQKLINSATKTSLKRLQTCISTNGGQSEQLLDQTESRYDKNIAVL